MVGALTVGSASPHLINAFGGVQDWRQMIARPVSLVDPYRTPIPGVFLCSSSTPPGGGVHGMCGFHAARSTLKFLARQ